MRSFSWHGLCGRACAAWGSWQCGPPTLPQAFCLRTACTAAGDLAVTLQLPLMEEGARPAIGLALGETFYLQLSPCASDADCPGMALGGSQQRCLLGFICSTGLPNLAPCGKDADCKSGVRAGDGGKVGSMDALGFRPWPVCCSRLSWQGVAGWVRVGDHVIQCTPCMERPGRNAERSEHTALSQSCAHSRATSLPCHSCVEPAQPIPLGRSLTSVVSASP